MEGRLIGSAPCSGAASPERRGYIGSAARLLLGGHGIHGIVENEVGRGDSRCSLESGDVPEDLWMAGRDPWANV